ncbi:MarR family winged helix-turn-helix transcriptional regulator [Cohaesibacter gelatinilyticus]|uniref:DNA-binding transcriptional regulator, MarR family n=1 Tax=Cohaesibacter gelatinilyticus TaxID=372072 RepID=A0A285PFL5_9HYPH|nr:MarR family transcriptional regulator [Cohaesibacter gelatinilyticus]SNZ20489.1 DNA-binding transcriptional regulator, MarR family [Cohaesibacter gelatinilyticus]
MTDGPNETIEDASMSAHQQQMSAENFDLKSFFPYLVRVYYQSVSGSVGDVYSSLYDLGVSEWRVMAVLAPPQSMSALDIIERSSMNKVNVSRAVARLRKRGFLKQDIDGDDRRRSVLRLTEEGRKVFYDLIPRVKEVERQLLAGLSEEEVRTLISLMARVRENASSLEL